jgi:hypothetical protein
MHCKHCGKRQKPLCEEFLFGRVDTSKGGIRSWRYDLELMPKSREEAQRTSNRKLVSFSWIGPKNNRRIRAARVWDGETYHKGHFCTIQCAIDFAYLFADQGRETTAHAEAVSKSKT